MAGPAGAQSDQQYLQADLLQPDSLKKLNGTALRKLLAQTTEQIGCRESLYVSYFVRGLVQYRLGNYESAADDYNHVIGLDASQAGAYLNRGLAAQALHNYSAALADMNTALKLMPDNAILYSNRGYLMQAQGRYAEAFRDYDKGISLAKTDPAIHINKIRLLTQLKRYPEALAILNSLTLLNAADIRLYAERADIYHAMHEDDQAVGEWDKAVAVSGNKPEVIIGRARFKDDVINDDEGAVADCNIAISAEPANGSHYYYRARPRYDLKRYQLVSGRLQQGHYARQHALRGLCDTRRCPGRVGRRGCGHS